MEGNKMFSLPLSIFLIASVATSAYLFPFAGPTSPSNGIKGAYWPSWLATTIPPANIPTEYFTHLFYAFVQVDPTSFQILTTQTDEQWMMNFTSTVHSSSSPAKAILSIGGDAQGNNIIFSNMSSNADNRAAFIKSSISIARKYGFDGFDLDWEFPQNSVEMSCLDLLYKECRFAIDRESFASGKPRLLLSSAVYFASDFFLAGNLTRTYPGDAITSYVDFISPMCYDYHGGWEKPSLTRAHAALYDKKSNISTSYGISTWKANGVVSEKIVMGMPVYGRTWQLLDPIKNGIGAPANGTGLGLGVLGYSNILDFNWANNATVVFDNTTISAYSYSGTNWIGYDDMDTVLYKIQYAKSEGLGGYFFWALGTDSNWDLARTASIAWDSVF